MSLTLAYELARRAGTAIKEEGLNFGPRTIPKDEAVIKSRKDVPEDRLFSFDKQVVQLKYPSATRGVSLQEEAEEALLAAQEEEEYEQESNYGGSTNYLSYADLGYVPETPKKEHQFVVGHIPALEDHIKPYEEEYAASAPKPCARGGSIVVRNHESEDYSEEDESEYSSEEKEDESYSLVRPGRVGKPCNTLISKFRPNKAYVKYTGITG